MPHAGWRGLGVEAGADAAQDLVAGTGLLKEVFAVVQLELLAAKAAGHDKVGEQEGRGVAMTLPCGQCAGPIGRADHTVAVISKMVWVMLRTFSSSSARRIVSVPRSELAVGVAWFSSCRAAVLAGMKTWKLVP